MANEAVKELNIFEERSTLVEEGELDDHTEEPAHHARRPMNAFLIFCKRHRPVVRDKYPHLENRSITKILGEWWANLEPSEKGSYTDLAKQYKEAFLKANPNFKWYKLPAPPLRTLMTRPSNQKPHKLDCQLACGPITPGKLADETQLGGLSSLLSSPPSTPTSPTIPKPPKKRYLQETMVSQEGKGPPFGQESLDGKVVSHANNESKPNPVLPENGNSFFGSEGPPQDKAKLDLMSPFTKLRSHAANQMGMLKDKFGESGVGKDKSGGCESNTETTIKASQQQIIDRVVDRLCGVADYKSTSLFSKKGTLNSWSLVPEYETVNNNLYKRESECSTKASEPSSSVNKTDSSQSASSASKDENDVNCTVMFNSLNKGSEVCDKFSETDSAISTRDEINASFGDVKASQVLEEVDAKDVTQCYAEHEGGRPRMNQEDSCEGATPPSDFTRTSHTNSFDDLSPGAGETRRKSLRACKGKRYLEFMNEGRISLGKRSRKIYGESFDIPSSLKKERRDSGSSSTSERTDSAFSEGSRGSRDPEDLFFHRSVNLKLKQKDLIMSTGHHGFGRENSVPVERKVRKHSETSEESFSDSPPKKRFNAVDFNLDEKIEALPSLSLEEFQQKKKARKKRNSPTAKKSTPPKTKKMEAQNNFMNQDRGGESGQEQDLDAEHNTEKGGASVPLVGSQKRKARKQCITRLDPESAHASRDTSVVEPDVLNNIGLATLAEVAAAKKRITK